MGEPCDDIYFVLNGVLDLVIEREKETGRIHRECFDILAKGSVMGFNSII